MSSIHQIIHAGQKDIGDGFIVRRSLPSITQRSVGPFVFWDHMGPVEINLEREMLVRAHPHIGLATITYLFSGEIMHRDSLNNEQPIRPGEVNWMTAGKGIVHSERRKIDSGSETLEGIQLWVALPVESEEVEPSFHHFKPEDLPSFKNQGVDFHLIAGSFMNHKSPVPVYSPLFYLNAKSNSSSSFNHQLEAGEEAAIYPIKGVLTIEGKEIKPNTLITFNRGSKVSVETRAGCEFMFFGGEAFPEKRHMWWNFVSSSKDRIEKAKRDWKEDQMGKVINEVEWIPLPD
ncbi:MAG: pirin family protein [Bdellovibrionales bacterium]